MANKIKQQYHLEPDQGLLNDPNGLTYFKGKYYVFFQWNRLKKDHSYKEWGLFTSKDMVNWQFEGSAIVPDQDYDKQGVYSGSAYVIDDKLHIYYTGNSKILGRRKSRQCLVLSGDGKQFHKEGMVIETPDIYTEHFRDPKVFKGVTSGYFMVIGGQRKNGKGALALCRSQDGKNWCYSNVLAISNQFEMIECPDLFKLDNKYVLLFNPQKRNNLKDISLFSFSVYKLVEFDEDTGLFQDKDLDHKCIKLDYGFDFYAPQTFQDPNGRRILFAWMSRMEEEEERIFAQNEPNIHCLTLPRKLFLKDGKLYQCPVKELYGMLENEIPILSEGISIKKAHPASRTFYLYIKKIEEGQNLSLNLHSGEVKLEYNWVEKKLLFMRHNWISHAYETKSCDLDRLREIEIWSDHSSIEVFINGGEAVFSSRIYPGDGVPEIRMTGVTKDTIIKVNEITKKVIRGGYVHE